MADAPTDGRTTGEEEEASLEREVAAREEEKAAQERERAAEEEGRAVREKEKAAKAGRWKGWGESAWGATKSAGRKTKAATGAAIGAGAAAGASAVGSVGDPGFVLFILGIVSLALKALHDSRVEIIFGVALIIYTVIAIFAWRGIVLVISFLAWYLFLGRNLDPLFLLTSLLPIVVVIMVIRGAIARAQGGSFRQGLEQEAAGIIPILAFFLDLGALQLIVQAGLAPAGIIETLIRYMPWWALLGIFTMRKQSAVINFFKIGGILYLTTIFILAAVPEAYGATRSAIPGPEQFVQAREQYEERFSGGEHIFWSSLYCIDQQEDFNGCVRQRQAESQDKAYCEKVEQKEPGTEEFNRCVAQRQELRTNPAAQATGVIDPTIKEPTTAELRLDRNSFPLPDEPRQAFPVELKIQNPRRQEITIELRCVFKDSLDNTLTGAIEGQSGFTFRDPSLTQPFFCLAPVEGVLAEYNKIEVWATLTNLNTKSRLERAFIGVKTAEQREKLWREEISRTITVAQSQAPADLARIDFWVGHAQDEIIIESQPYKSIAVYANIKNAGRGDLAAVHSYDLQMENGFLSVQNPECLAGSLSSILRDSSIIPLPKCLVTDYPGELKNPQNWIPKTFIASLDYDYVITTEEALPKGGSAVS